MPLERPMARIIVLGGGRQGRIIANDLASDHDITVADIAAVKVGLVAVGAVGLSLPHPTANRLTATARAGDQRFIGLLLLTLTGQFDAENTALRIAAKNAKHTAGV